MISGKPSADRYATTHQPQRFRAALAYVTQGMRELEEQLPLPTDRRLRDTTPARQKATALRVDIEDLNRRLTRISQHIREMNRIGE